MNKYFVFSLLLLAFIGGRAQATIVLTVQPSSASYMVGDVGFIDVMVHSTSSDALDSFAAQVSIAGGLGAQFASPGMAPEAYLSDLDYVFFQRSANFELGVPAIASTSLDGLSTSFADFTFDTGSAPPGDPLPVTLPDSTTPLLLARLQFTAVGAGNFTVDVDPSPTSSFFDGAATEFDFTSTPGAFSITAVPEPSSIALVGLVGVGGYFYRRRSAKRTTT